MKDLSKIYQDFCKKKGITFKLDDSVRSYDETTLFCPAGMQQFKDKFKNPDNTTIANIQSCIRLNDLDEIGDGTHMLHFKMIGLFSFGELTINEAVDFWVEFVRDVLEINIDYVTVHPDRFDDWKWLYERHKIVIKLDEECIWSDGEMGGYCTEFYHKEIEIGNIVNTLDKFIDVGFGYSRLDDIINENKKLNENDILKDAISKIIDSGFKPGPQKQGYVLRKLLRQLYVGGGNVDHPFFEKEIQRQERAKLRYERLKEKHSDKTKEWWFDTHGIDLDEMN
jgi:alanyl-tRNA synthetase